MGNNNSTDKQRFMELMQRCLPPEWKKYWDCVAKDFDSSIMLQEIENPRLHIQDRLLLLLLVGIRLEDVDWYIDLTHAARTLDEGQRQLDCRMDQ